MNFSRGCLTTKVGQSLFLFKFGRFKRHSFRKRISLCYYNYHLAGIALMFLNSLQPSAALYFSTLSAGTYSGMYRLTPLIKYPLKLGGVEFKMVTLASPLHPLKAFFPIVVTLLGMIMLVRPVQPKKVLLPIVVTLLGIVTLVRPEQL